MIASMMVCKARALLRIAADSDPTRQYLRGFWLEPSGVACATDGACLLAIRGLHVDFQGPPVLIQRDALEPFLKGKAATDLLVIERGGFRIGAASVGHAHPEAGEAVYPNWRRIIPQSITGRCEHDGKNGVERSCLDSRLLERLRIALGELNCKAPAKAPPVFPMFNGLSAAVLDTDADTLAILMPMRTGKTFTVPDMNAHCASWSAQTMEPARKVPTTPADIDTAAA